MPPAITVKIPTDGEGGYRVYSYDEALAVVRKHIDDAEYRSAVAVSRPMANALLDDYTAQTLAAQALWLNQNPRAAKRYADRASALDEHALVPKLLRSRIALAMGDHDVAGVIINEAISTDPENSSLYQEKADQLSAMGDVDGARNSYLAALARNSRNSNSLLNLSLLPGATLPERSLKKYEFIISSGQFQGRALAHAHFALANIYDRLGNVAQHFKHLHAGNAIVSAQYQYDPQLNEAKTHELITFFSHDFFRNFPQLNHNNRKILFIVGMPRCGSTLVEQILCSHTQVSDAGENPYLMNAINNFATKSRAGRFPGFITRQTYPALHTIAEEYLQNIDIQNDCMYVTDKTLGNYNCIGLMHLLFPEAHFIHVKRNPVATCYGCYKRLFSQGHITYAYKLEHLAATYRDYESLMRHWDSVLPGRVHTIEYETLVKQQEKTTRELLALCGLPWEASCLDFHDNKRSVMTSSNTQVRQKLYQSSIDRWQQFEDHLGPLLPLIDSI